MMHDVLHKMSLTSFSKLWLRATHLYAAQFWLGLVTEQVSSSSPLLGHNNQLF